MLVTEIAELSKTRCKVFIENEFAFVLYKGELRLYHLQEGREISEEDYCRIMREVLPKRAKLRAMNLLKSRDYTTAKLREKLEQGGYPQAVIEETLEYVASYHYTDDLRYAVSYMTCYENQRSRRRIEQDLYARGIPKEILEQAWLEWESQGGCCDEQEMIKKLLEKKGYDSRTADNKEKQRIFAFLMRKGFSPEQIRKAMNSENMDSYT
ncbi:MAG: regulatory protein RecX [Roseburia sp.]|nr:regulatory protein RecX [Roseburia sp.]